MSQRHRTLQEIQMQRSDQVAAAVTAPNLAVTVSLCFCIAVLEGFDIQAIGVAAPRLAPEFGLAAAQLGWVFSISNIGMVLGAMAGGWLADRVGRKPVLIAAVALFGVFTALTAFAARFETLFAARMLTGLGFGAALPNIMAIAAEVSAPQNRSSTASAMFCGMPLGGGVVALVTQVLPPDFGWRGLFVIGGLLPVLLVPALLLLMPETLSTGRKQGASSNGTFKALFGQGRAAPTLLLWLTFLPTMLILYLFLNWLPTLVVAKGLDKAVAPQAALAFNLASVAGALLLGRLVDRCGPRWPLVIAYGVLIASLLGLASATDLSRILFFSGIAGFAVLGANYALYGVAAAYYPQAVRGTGSGASVAVGRIGSIVGPALAGVLLGAGMTATSVVQYLAPAAAAAGAAVFALSFFRQAD